MACQKPLPTGILFKIAPNWRFLGQYNRVTVNFSNDPFLTNLCPRRTRKNVDDIFKNVEFHRKIKFKDFLSIAMVIRVKSEINVVFCFYCGGERDGLLTELQLSPLKRKRFKIDACHTQLVVHPNVKQHDNLVP